MKMVMLRGAARHLDSSYAAEKNPSDEEELSIEKGSNESLNIDDGKQTLSLEIDELAAIEESKEQKLNVETAPEDRKTSDADDKKPTDDETEPKLKKAVKSDDKETETKDTNLKEFDMKFKPTPKEKASVSKPSCKDNTQFMYKNLEGYDCTYIKQNKPEKCSKSYNEQVIGLVHCPESCGMVEVCLEAEEGKFRDDSFEEGFSAEGDDGEPETFESESEKMASEANGSNLVDEEGTVAGDGGADIEIISGEDEIFKNKEEDKATAAVNKEQKLEPGQPEETNGDYVDSTSEDGAGVSSRESIDAPKKKSSDTAVKKEVVISEDDDDKSEDMEGESKKPAVKAGFSAENDDDERASPVRQSSKTVNGKARESEDMSAESNKSTVKEVVGAAATTEDDEEEVSPKASVLKSSQIDDNISGGEKKLPSKADSEGFSGSKEKSASPKRENGPDEVLVYEAKKQTEPSSNAEPTEIEAGAKANIKETASVNDTPEAKSISGAMRDDESDGTSIIETDAEKIGAKSKIDDESNTTKLNKEGSKPSNQKSTPAADLTPKEKNEDTKQHDVCKDDPNFLYNGLEGFDCDYIKKTNPETCTEKKENGNPVGESCPETCAMVSECLEADGRSKEGKKVGVSASEVDQDISEELAQSKPQTKAGSKSSGEEAEEDTISTGESNQTATDSESDSDLDKESNDTVVSFDASDDKSNQIETAVENQYDDATSTLTESETETSQSEKEEENDAPSRSGDKTDVSQTFGEEAESKATTSSAQSNQTVAQGMEDGTALVSSTGNGEVEDSGVEDIATTKTANLCRDNPVFTYKDLEGYDCDYIKTNKPEKCLKEFNGQKVGLTACPESCDMVEECLDMFGASEDSTENMNEGVFGDEVKLPSENDKAGSEIVLEGKSDPDELPFENKSTIIENAKVNGADLGSNITVTIEEEVISLDVDANSTDEGIAVSSEGETNSTIILSYEEKDSMPSDTTQYADLTSSTEVNNEKLNSTEDEEISTFNSAANSAGTGKTIVTKEPNLCKDNPTFMYKDQEGYDCDYIKSNKPEKCHKEYNGQKIGLVACPQSCEMVEECLEAFGGSPEESMKDMNEEVFGTSGNVDGSTAEADSKASSLSSDKLTELSSASYNSEPEFIHDPCSDVVSFRLDDDPDKDCAWLYQNERCEREHDESGKMIGRYYCPVTCGLLEAKCAEAPNNEDHDAHGVSKNDESFSSNAEPKPIDNDEDLVSNANETKNTEQELDGEWEMLEQKAEQYFGGGDFAEKVMQDEVESEWKSNNTSLAGVNLGDDAVDGDTGYTDDYGQYTDDYNEGEGYTYQSIWNENNGGYTKTNEWNKNENENVYSEPSSSATSWSSNEVYGQNENPSTAAWNNQDKSYGQIGQQENRNNPTNYQQEEYNRVPAETWEDDDNGFPVGMLLLFLIFLVGFLYFRKNRQSSSTQGGYQRVEQPMYMNKRS